MNVQVFIPHYFLEAQGSHQYGSSRLGSRTARSLALGRCLSALLNLRQRGLDLELNHSRRTVDELPATEADANSHTEVGITICKIGDDYLKEVTDIYREQITLLDVELEDPKLLALATRDRLVQSKIETDLAIYLEDDLIIHDPHYFRKMAWFQQKTNHKMCLMPHRYERIDTDREARILVDGPLRPGLIGKFSQPQRAVASGKYLGLEEVVFDIAENPHAGTFCVSNAQIQFLRRQTLATEGFIGPLETAATLTVLQHFSVLKPSRDHRNFLMVEHGHPSFKHYTKSFPRRRP